MTSRSVLRPWALVLSVLLLPLLATPSVLSGPAAPAAFDLQALIKAAQAEGNLVVYHTSSRVTVAGRNFEKKYGIKVRGTKMADPEQAERVIREVDSGRVQVDAIGFEDGPLLETKLLPQGYVINWMPPDLKGTIGERYTLPVVDRLQPRIFAYNTDSFGRSCPATNVWDLTEPKWKGKVLLRDPVLTPANLAFFASIVNQSDLLDKAHRDLFGKAPEFTEAPSGRVKNAGWEFLRRLFRNDIVTMRSDGDIGDAVGAAGQRSAPIGMVTLTKLRDNQEMNLKLATCKGLQPFMGYALPAYALVVKNAPHPNAARLWVRYMLTPEGISPWTVDDMGSFSPHPRVPMHPDNEGTWAQWEKHLLPLDNRRAMALRQDILDFWLKHGAR